MKSSYRDLANFFGSTATTLKAQGQRVRNLIGEKHWQSDGSYKERLLKKAIREVVPSTLRIGDGFLIYRKDREQEDFEISRQIDILVYDDRYVAPIFRDDDFVVILAETALATIEVKSNWGKDFSKLAEELEKIQIAHNLYRLARNDGEPLLFTACIAFSTPQPQSSKTLQRFVRKLKESFINGLEKYRHIGPKINIADLNRIDFHIVRQLCPEMIVSLDLEWILTPGIVNPINSSNLYQHVCPVVTQVSTVTNNKLEESVNLSLHLFLGTLRHRCLDWLNQGRIAPTSGSLGGHLSSLLSLTNYEQMAMPVALIPELEGIRDIFPEANFAG